MVKQQLTWTNERRKLRDLTPWEHNPRYIKDAAAERLIESFNEFGQVLPVCIGPNNEVYDGHQRRSVIGAADDYGFDYEIDVRVASRALTERERQKLTVYLHQGAAGNWDWEELANSFDFDDLVLWGFDEDQLLGMGFDEPEESEPSDAEPQIDRAEELRQKWGVETGQLWKIGEHRLICGDCTDAEVVARVMGGEKAAIVSDPPYGINVDTSWLSALNMQRGKPTNISDDKLQNDDGTLDLSWVYGYKEWLVFGFPYIARNESYTGLLVWDKRGDGGEDGLGNPVEVAASNAFNGYRLKRHVWAGYIREAGEHREPHPTQKPIGIMEDAVNLIKSKIIYEPFAGSGTTLVACENLSRKCRAIEISPSYCGVILERMATAFPGIEIERL